MEHPQYTTGRLRSLRIHRVAHTLLFAVMIASVARAQPAYQHSVQLGSAGDDMAFSTTIGADGATYVTGYFRGTIDFDPGEDTANLTALYDGDGFVAKYDDAGNYVWAFRFGGAIPPGSSGLVQNRGQFISVDAYGYVVVAGWLNGSTDLDPGPDTALFDAGVGSQFIARYSPTGSFVWAFQFRPAATGWTSSAGVYAMTLDAGGNILLAGHFNGSIDFDPGPGTASMNAGHNGYGSMFVAKYTPSGSYLWAFSILSGNTTKTFNNRANPSALVADGSGNVYVTGSFSGTVNFNPGGGAKANLTSAGGGGVLGGDGDIFLAKYSTDGRYAAAARLGGTGWDNASSLAIDGSGNLYVSGNFTGTVDFNPGSGTNNLTTTGTAYETYVAGYTSNFGYRWAFGMRGGTGARLAVDGNDNIAVAGSNRTGGSVDLDPGAGTAIVSTSSFVGSYTSTGAYRWGFGTSVLSPVIAAGGSDMVLAGEFRNNPIDIDPGTDSTILIPNGGYDIVVARFTEATSWKPVIGNELTGDQSAMFVSPNPFSASFTIRCASSAPAQIQVLDMMGRIVETGEVEALNGAIALGTTLPAGVYIVRVAQREIVRTTMVHKVN